MTRPTGRPPGRPPTHGIYSARIVSVLAESLAEQLGRWCAAVGVELEPADEPSLRLLARKLVIAQLLWADVVRRGAINSRGRPTPSAVALVRVQGSLTRMLGQMGLNPLGRSRLRRVVGRGVVVDARRERVELRLDDLTVERALRNAATGDVS